MRVRWCVALAVMASLSAWADPLELRRLTVPLAAPEKLEVPGKEAAHWGKVESETQWSSCDAQHRCVRVVEVVLGKTSRRSLSGYLQSWRGSHGCTAAEVKGLPRLTLNGKALPQLAFDGVCEAPEQFIVHVVLIGDVVYELHVDRPLFGAATDGGAVPVRETLRALLEQVTAR